MAPAPAYSPFLAMLGFLLEQTVCENPFNGTGRTSREICDGLFNMPPAQNQGESASPSNSIEAKGRSVTKRGHLATAVSKRDGNVPDTESLQTLLFETSIWS